MDLSESKKTAPKKDNVKSKNSLDEFKPYHMVNGALTKENQIFCMLWKNIVPFFSGLEQGLDKKNFEEIVRREAFRQYF